MARLLEAARLITTMKGEIGGDVAYSLTSQGFFVAP